MKRSGLELCDAACRTYTFFCIQYTNQFNNIDCHEGHLKGESGAIFSQMALYEEA